MRTIRMAAALVLLMTIAQDCWSDVSSVTAKVEARVAPDEFTEANPISSPRRSNLIRLAEDTMDVFSGGGGDSGPDGGTDRGGPEGDDRYSGGSNSDTSGAPSGEEGGGPAPLSGSNGGASEGNDAGTTDSDDAGEEDVSSDSATDMDDADSSDDSPEGGPSDLARESLPVGELQNPGDISSDGKWANRDGHNVPAPDGYRYERDEDGWPDLVPDTVGHPVEKQPASPSTEDRQSPPHESIAPTIPLEPITAPPAPPSSESPPAPLIGEGIEGQDRGSPSTTDSSPPASSANSSPTGNPGPTSSGTTPASPQTGAGTGIARGGESSFAHRSTNIQSIAAAKAYVATMQGANCGSNGQCASLTKALAPGLGPTSTWKRGEYVQGNTNIPIGTAIATFNFHGQKGTNGYGPPSSPGGRSGRSHTGIYMGQTAEGLQIGTVYLTHPPISH